VIHVAKESGLGWTTLSVDDGTGSAQAIKNDVTNFQFATPRGVYDWTGVDKSAYERGLGLADFSITLNGIFNDAANMSHAVLKTIPSTSVQRLVTLAVSGQTLANECIGTDYNLTRAADGNLTWTAPFVLADGNVPTWS
jgi:hypothetical protein